MKQFVMEKWSYSGKNAYYQSLYCYYSSIYVLFYYFSEYAMPSYSWVLKWCIKKPFILALKCFFMLFLESIYVVFFNWNTISIYTFLRPRYISGFLDKIQYMLLLLHTCQFNICKATFSPVIDICVICALCM